MTWKDDLNEDIKGSPAFKDLGDDVNDLAKNYLDAQGRIGNSIRVPSEDATPEDIAKFHERLVNKVPGLIPTPDLEDPSSIKVFMETIGTPKDADAYEMPEVEGITVDEKREKLIRDTALEVGMTKKQLTGFLNKMYEADSLAVDVANNGIEEDALSLKKKWGVTHKKRMEALHQNLLLSEAPEVLSNLIKNDRAGSETTQWLDNLFSKLGETGELKKHEDDTGHDEVEVSEATERAAEIRKKMTAPGMQTTGPEYNALLKKLLKYEKMAHPDSGSNINDLRA